MDSNPIRSLVLVLLGAVALSGWLYGLHWKQVAAGGSFNSGEEFLVRLLEQIEVLSERNQELNEELARAEGRDATPTSGMDPGLLPPETP